MDKIPTEILQAILSLLGSDDLGSSRLVSPAWLTVASQFLFRQVQVHGCVSSCRKLHSILSNKGDLVREIRTYWVVPENPAQFEQALTLIRGTTDLGLIVGSYDCSSCEKRHNGDAQPESTVVWLFLKALSENQVGLKKLLLMENNHGNPCSLQTLKDHFSEPISSVEYLGLSAGQSSFAFESSSLRCFSAILKKLRTLRLETDTLRLETDTLRLETDTLRLETDTLRLETDIFPEDIVWDQLTDMSLRVQDTAGLEQFVSRHLRLKRLSVTLDLVPPMAPEFRLDMIVILKKYLDADDAEKITRVANRVTSPTAQLSSFLRAALRRVRVHVTRTGLDAGLFETIEKEVDAVFTALRNDSAAYQADKLRRMLNGRAIQYHVSHIKMQSILSRVEQGH